MENKVIAKVGDREITQSEVMNYIRMLGENGRQFMNEEGQNYIAENMVREELFYHDALAQGMDKDSDYIEEMDRMAVTVLKQYAIHKLISTMALEEEELKAYYESHLEHFTTPLTMRASHILVEDEAAANDIIDEITEGLSFEEAAEKYSNCPSKEKGGDLGQFSEGQMVPEFEEAGKTLPLNTLSKPIKTQFGYHIIKVTDRQDPSVKSFDEVRPTVENQYRALKQQEAFVNKAKDLETVYTVERFY